MSETLIGRALVAIDADFGGFGKKVAHESGAAGKKAGHGFGATFKKSLGEMNLGDALKLGSIIEGLHELKKVAKESVEAFETQEKQIHLVDQAIKLTGGSAGVTSKQVKDLADTMSLKTGIDNKQIIASEQVLLRFKGVRNEVGKNNDIYNRAAKAALDLSTGMGKGLTPVTIALGKALDNPVKGMSALGRVGVYFTKGQQDQIKALVAGGHALDAQSIILGKVETRFKGAAAAAATPLERLKAAGTQLKESFGEGIVGGLDPLANALVKLMPVVKPLITALGEGLGGVISGLAPILSAVVPALSAIVGPLTAVAGVIGRNLGDAMKAVAPLIGPLFGALAMAVTPIIGTLSYLAKVILPPLAQVFTTLAVVARPFISLIASMASTVISALEPALKAVTPVFVMLGQMFANLMKSLSGEGGQLDGFFESIGDTLKVIAPVLGEVATILAKGLMSAFRALAPFVKQVADIFAKGLRAALPPMVKAFVALAKALTPILPVLAKVAGTIAVILVKALMLLYPIIAKVAEAFAGALGKALPPIANALLDVVTALEPLLTPSNIEALLMLVSPFMFLLKVLTPVLPVIAKVAGVIAGVLAKAMVALMPIISQVANILADGLTQVLQDLAPALPPLADALGQIALAALAILKAILPLIPPLLKVAVLLIDKIGVPVIVLLAKALATVATALAKVVTWVANLVGAFTHLDFGKIAAAIGHFFQDLPGNIVGWLGDLGGLIWGWVTGAFDFVVEQGPKVLTGLLAFFVGLPALIIGALAEFGPKILGWMVDGFTWLASNLLNGLASFFVFWVTLPFKLVAGLINLGGLLVRWAIKGFTYLKDNLPKAWAAVLDFFKGLPGRIMGAIHALGSFGRKLFAWAVEAFQSLARRGGEFISSAIDFFKSIPGRFINGVKKGISLGSRLFSWVKDAFGTVKRRGGELLSSALSFFKSVPGKLLNAMISGGTKVGHFVGNLASKIWGGIKGFVNSKLLDPIRDFGVSILGHKIHPFSGIPHLAEGAIVDHPTTVLVGEDGPEIVLPLSKPGRMAELLKKAGLLDSSGALTIPGVAVPQVDPAALTAAAVPAMVGVGVAASDATGAATGAFQTFTPAVIAALSTFGQTVWTAIAPTFAFLNAQIQASFQALLDFIVAWPATVWAGLASPLDTFNLNVRSSFASMADTTRSTLTTLATDAESIYSGMLSSMAGASTTGGSGIVSALRSALSEGTGEVQRIVHGYAVKLAESLSPILVAIGEKKIDASAFRSGGITDPRIVADGSNQVHVFGERGTHGEAYIPFDPALRGRSRKIAAETVERLGGVSYFRQGGVTGDTQGLNPTFMQRLVSWAATVGQDFYIKSGFRSYAEQVQAYQAYLAHRGNKAAIPGRSNHEFGLAADGPHWGRYNPAAFRLRYPMGDEPWHVEPFEAKAWRAMMPDSGWTGSALQPLPKVPDAGKRALISTVAKNAMDHVYDTALKWAGGQSMGGVPGVVGPETHGSIQDMAKAALASRGWASYWRDLDTLVSHESGWNPRAQNPHSTAYGLFQFLDDTWGGVGGSKTSDPGSQIRMGLDYISQRYGTPAGAWDFWSKNHWYGQGALFNRPQVVGVGEDGPEVLLPLSKPQRALQLAVDSGLMRVLDGARPEQAPASDGAPYDGGILGGRPGNTYKIYGLGMDDVMAKIRANDEAADRVRE